METRVSFANWLLVSSFKRDHPASELSATTLDHSWYRTRPLQLPGEKTRGERLTEAITSPDTSRNGMLGVTAGGVLTGVQT